VCVCVLTVCVYVSMYHTICTALQSWQKSEIYIYIYIRTSPLLSRVPVNMLLGAVLWPCAAVAPILLADRRSRSIPPASGEPSGKPAACCCSGQ